MQVYLVKGEGDLRLDFIKNLASKLAGKEKTLLLSFHRSKNKNIEDLFNMAGMISYDISDYFLEYIKLDKLITKGNDKTHFIIPPFLENKYEFKKEDIDSLIKNLSDYDNIIIDGLDSKLLDKKKTIRVIKSNQISESIKSDYFIINAKDDFDPRLKRDEILGKDSKFLGIKKDNNDYGKILKNLKEEKKEDIGKLSLMEKIKMRFTKWNLLYS